MRVGNAHAASTWWWVVGLLIAIPALSLAGLGLRSVRLDRLEWEQQTAEHDRRTARLVDLELDHALQAIETAALQDLGAISTRPSDTSPGRVFSVDTDGTVTFVREQVYVRNTGSGAAFLDTLLSPDAARLIRLAQAADAQGRNGELREHLYRLAREAAAFADWARWMTARVAYSEGRPGAIRTLSDPAWSRSTGRTPDRLPVALVAAALASTAVAGDRPQFRPLVQSTLQRLRSGAWLLSIDERQYYDDELRRLCALLDPSAPANTVDPLDNLAAIAAVIKENTPPRNAATRSVSRLGQQPVLLLWPVSEASRTTRLGVFLSPSDLHGISERIVRPLAANTLSIRDAAGLPVWVASGSTDADGVAYTLRSLPGWDMTVARIAEPAALSQRRLLWFGLILMLVVMLGTGLVMAGRARQQELALARRQADFVAAVSHEFKSPLTSIRLHLERLASGRASSSEAAQYYGAVEQDAARLERLVNRLLDSQQVQEGRKFYSFEPASIAAAAGAAVTRLRPQAAAKRIHLDLRAEDGEADARFDSMAIGDAIENLVENAIKYSRTGSVVSIATSADDSVVQVRVEDRGIGIDADDLPRIFDKFFRGRRSDATDVRGTGLGLSLVKAIVDGHGGSIAVSSVAGVGSTFSVSLPRRPQDTEAD